MTGEPTLTVVISTLDRPVELAVCLDALMAGSRLPAEVVVVDQGDPAPTRQVLDDRAGRGVALRHVVQQRRGLSASQNAGVQAARGAAVAVVDDDCVPDPRWVEVAERAHAGADGPLLVTGRVLPLPPDGPRTVAVSSRTSQERVEHGPDAMPWSVGTGGNFSVTRTAYLQVGGNDEVLGTGTPGRGGNDLDLFHRLLRAGVPARYEPDLLVHHGRVTPEERRGRRWSYGFGVGACGGRWLRAGDRTARRVLLAWLVMRWHLLRGARRPAAVVDELRVLLGTVHGLLYGLRLPAPPPGPLPADPH